MFPTNDVAVIVPLELICPEEVKFPRIVTVLLLNKVPVWPTENFWDESI